VLGETRRATAVGQPLLGLTVRGGALIRGLIINNPSGQWLRVYPDGKYIAPYTLNWALSWEIGHTTLDIKSGEAPAGQINTQQGDPFSATLYEEQVGSSPGSQDPSFIEQFTPVLVASSLLFVPYTTGAVSQPLFPAVANKRYRVLTTSASLGAGQSIPAGTIDNYDSGALYTIRDTTGSTIYAQGRVNPHHPVDARTYPSGFDSLFLGAAILCDIGPDYSNISIEISVTAQLI
jgi:hypothetical protein